MPAAPTRHFAFQATAFVFSLRRVKKQKAVMPNAAADVSVRTFVQEYQGNPGVPRQPNGVPRQPRESQGNPVGEGECYLFLALFLAGNRAVLLGNQRFSRREIA